MALDVKIPKFTVVICLKPGREFGTAVIWISVTLTGMCSWPHGHVVQVPLEEFFIQITLCNKFTVIYCHSHVFGCSMEGKLSLFHDIKDHTSPLPPIMVAAIVPSYGAGIGTVGAKAALSRFCSYGQWVQSFSCKKKKYLKRSRSVKWTPGHTSWCMLSSMSAVWNHRRGVFGETVLLKMTKERRLLLPTKTLCLYIFIIKSTHLCKPRSAHFQYEGLVSK